MDARMQGYRDTKIQGYRDTGIQGYRDKRIQGYMDGDTWILGYKIQVCSNKMIQDYRDT